VTGRFAKAIVLLARAHSPTFLAQIEIFCRKIVAPSKFHLIQSRIEQRCLGFLMIQYLYFNHYA